MCAEEVKLDDDGVVGVVHRDEFVALVWEGGTALGKISADFRFAVKDIARRDELIARMREGPDGGVKVLAVLRVHVLEHDRLAPLAHSTTPRALLAHLAKPYPPPSSRARSVLVSPATRS